MKESDVRFTPQDVLDVVREFAPIMLDPCTTEANPVGAALHFTAQDDGLGTDWLEVINGNGPLDGVAFVNPPYSRGQLMKWAVKSWTEAQFGIEVIALVPADTSTRAVQFLLQRANAVAFWKKRIRFAGDAGAKFANAFFYFGERQGRFTRVFSPHAYVQVLR